MNVNDDKVMQMLAGANFGPNTKVILPSGEEIDGTEAQALTSFYAKDANEH